MSAFGSPNLGSVSFFLIFLSFHYSVCQREETTPSPTAKKEGKRRKSALVSKRVSFGGAEKYNMNISRQTRTSRALSFGGVSLPEPVEVNHCDWLHSQKKQCKIYSIDILMIIFIN
jgi:hypothetical protein